MRILTISMCLLFLLSGMAMTVHARDEKRHSGVETSAEQKSEEGLVHGKAYAGSKEKKVKEEDATKEDDSGKGKGKKGDKSRGKQSN